MKNSMNIPSKQRLFRKSNRIILWTLALATALFVTNIITELLLTLGRHLTHFQP